MVISYNILNPKINTLEIAILQCKNEGGIWDYNSGTCLKKSTTSTSISCPSGEQLIGSVCVPIQTSCPSGYEPNPNGQGCIPIVINKQTSCPTGYNLVNGQCVLIQSSTPPSPSHNGGGYGPQSTSGTTTSSSGSSTSSSSSASNLTEILMQYKYEIIGALFVIIIIYYITRK